MEVFQLPKEEKLEESLDNVKRPTKFMLDEEGEADGVKSAKKENEDDEEEDHAFPPGSDRLDDILDEID